MAFVKRNTSSKWGWVIGIVVIVAAAIFFIVKRKKSGSTVSQLPTRKPATVYVGNLENLGQGANVPYPPLVSNGGGDTSIIRAVGSTSPPIIKVAGQSPLYIPGYFPSAGGGDVPTRNNLPLSITQQWETQPFPNKR